MSKAKAELAKAGKVNYSTPLKINVVNGFSDWQTGAQVMQSELKSAGFNVSIQALDYAAYFADLAERQVRYVVLRYERRTHTVLPVP